MYRIAIVLGSFHFQQVSEMLEAARNESKKLNLEIVEEVWVTGSMEKPLAIKRLLQKPNIDGVVVLGIIEKGETAHGRVMAEAVIQVLLQLQLEFMKPLGVGILGPEIEPHQIQPRLVNYAKQAVTALAKMLQ